MAYNDANQGYITYAPTVHRCSQRLLLCMAACDRFLYLLSYDITKIYIRSKTLLVRPIYVKPLDVLKIPSNLIISLERPLYGVCKARACWCNMYHNHHLCRLFMKFAIHDRCFAYTLHFCIIDAYAATPHAITGLLSDDTLTICNNAFLKLEVTESSTLSWKPHEEISSETPLRFISATKSAFGACYTLYHYCQLEIMTLLNVESFNKVDLISRRARIAYIVAVYRPYVTYHVQ